MNDNLIIARNESNKLIEFKQLMELTNSVLNERATAAPQDYKSLNGTALEGVVCNTMKELCGSTSFRPNDIELKSAQSFPDIITTYFRSEDSNRYYGVEVKTTKENRWTSTGSSIVESSRIADVSRILMLFGKLGDPIEFKCRPYEECLSGIAVTHSPRYLIDMGLDQNDNIFAKMNTDYDSFRCAPDNIDQVRQYYIREASSRNRVQMPWWMNGTTNVNLSFFGDLDTPSKFKLISKALILFDESYHSEYKRVSLWFCTRHSVLAPNIRDSFSAGGQCRAIDGQELAQPYPQIVNRLLSHLEQIEQILINPSDNFIEEIRDFWQPEKLESNLYEQWIGRVERTFKQQPSLKYIPIRKLIERKSKVTSI